MTLMARIVGGCSAFIRVIRVIRGREFFGSKIVAFSRRAAAGLACVVASAAAPASPSDFAREIRPLLAKYCFDCHSEDIRKSELDLERFTDLGAARRDRATWGRVMEKVESRQMPPPKEGNPPSLAERQKLIDWLGHLAALPDPDLGTRDPGRPVLRRLTRLEYNNTVRDLLGLEDDLFLFPERVLLRDKDYFLPETGRMPEPLTAQLLEFGSRRPALLAGAGLPSDNRAEHGYRNRGDAMNLSPLLLEQYLAIAGEIVRHPELPRRSRQFAELLGLEFVPLARPAASRTGAPAMPADAVVGDYAPKLPALPIAPGSALTPSEVRAATAEALRTGRGGVFPVGPALANTTIAGKGAVLRLPYGPSPAKHLAINPDQDLWLVGFSTAEATSGNLLFTNKAKQQKRFELTFKVEGGEPHEGIAQLAVCVLGRAKQSGAVVLTARASDGTEQRLLANLAEGPAGTTHFAFAALPGETIKSLAIDGSGFSGDHVLLDDLAFVTNGAPRTAAAARPVGRAEPAPVPAPGKGGKAIPALLPAGLQRRDAAATPAPRPASERLTAFLDRAFRRPATGEERTRYVGLFERARAAGASEADAMRTAIQAVLAAPGFLFIAEPVHAAAGAVRPLDNFELATRLSYFLWSTAPDGELLMAARRGTLREPAELRTQVRRLLRDRRVRELSESFAVQWLRLDQLYTAQPDRDLFKAFYSGPQGKDTLHAAMMLEALLLFETVLVEDRSILDFIDADYTWINPRLARLYGIDLARGASAPDGVAAAAAGQPNRELRQNDRDANHRWTRVALRDRNRGGFLTMAGPLTVTSLPFRTSPVKRGAWLLETVFNRPPQEPKVAFAVSNDTKEAALNLSIRERFEAHRNKPECYSCHIRLDPPGFALERFDAVGAWRERDGPSPVDARAEWNDTAFEGPAGFKAAVMKNPDEFVRGFIEHLLAYALGRKLEFFDQPAVAEIQQQARSNGYRFSAIVEGVATAYPFLHIRN
jgi:hypothetical protein